MSQWSSNSDNIRSSSSSEENIIGLTSKWGCWPTLTGRWSNVTHMLAPKQTYSFREYVRDPLLSTTCRRMPSWCLAPKYLVITSSTAWTILILCQKIGVVLQMRRNRICTLSIPAMQQTKKLKEWREREKTKTFVSEDQVVLMWKNFALVYLFSKFVDFNSLGNCTRKVIN